MAQSVRFSLSALLCVLLFVPVAAQEKRLRTFVDALEQPVLADPQLSPDGKQIAFVIDRADWKANRRIGHIFRINVDGTSQVQLTFGERGESSPRWSPDGKSIAFTARRDPDTANQIYLLHAEGGEARKITSHATATGEHHLGARRQVDLFHRHRRQVRRGARARSRAGRCVCVRGEQLQAAPLVDHGSRGQDEADHRRRLVGRQLRAERRRHAHRDARACRARCSSSPIAPKCG